MEIGTITFDTTPSYVNVWRSQAPLRFILRDGKKILQAPWMNMGTGDVEWRDVELVEEK